MHLYLRYRSSISDPWQEPPPFPLQYPTSPTGSLPVRSVRIESGPETSTPCGCPGAGTTEDHLIANVDLGTLPPNNAKDLLLYLLRFKSAPIREAKMNTFAQGAYITASLSNITAREMNKEHAVSFRLATPITTAIA